MIPTNTNAMVEDGTAVAVNDETNAARPKATELAKDLDAIVRAYESKRAVDTRRKYAQYRERGDTGSCASYEEWAGHERGALVDRHNSRMMVAETTARERADLIALGELYARAECVGTGRPENPDGREPGAAMENGDQVVWFGPAERLERDEGSWSNKESTDLERLFVVTWRKHRAALRRERTDRPATIRGPAESCGLFADDRSSSEDGSTTDRRKGQGRHPETASDVAKELDAIVRAYESERVVYTRRKYTEYCERGGLASTTSFDEWSGYEQGARVDRHKRRMMALETSRHERVDLIALEELFARSEYASTRRYENQGGPTTVNAVDDEYHPFGPAERLEWDKGRRSNNESTDLKRLFVVTWRKHRAALRRERTERWFAVRGLAESCGLFPDDWRSSAEAGSTTDRWQSQGRRPQKAGDVAKALNAIVSAYESERAVDTRRKYAEYCERGGPESRTSFEVWAGHEQGALVDRLKRRMIATETTRRERVDLMALEELYARAGYVSRGNVGTGLHVNHGGRERGGGAVDDDDEDEDLLVDPEWARRCRRSNNASTDLRRLFVVTWRKHKAALRRQRA